MTDSNDTGLLTQSQREFLQTDDPDMTERGKRAAKSRIRSRLRAAFDDLHLLLGDGEVKQQIDLEEVLADMHGKDVWPLATLLFLWSVEHPRITDRDDMTERLSSGGESTDLESQMDRITASFDHTMETGVRAAFEFGSLDHVPEEITNDLTVLLGEPVSERSDEELAQMSGRTIDMLFRRGDLDNSEYARIMDLKLKSDDEWSR